VAKDSDELVQSTFAKHLCLLLKRSIQYPPAKALFQEAVQQAQSRNFKEIVIEVCPKDDDDVRWSPL
jgi:hypothetical protein